MGDEASGFVDDKDVRIFTHDVEWERFRHQRANGPRRFRCGQIHDDRLSRLDATVRRHHGSIQPYHPRREPALNLRT